jgi:hypothetical protein
MMPFPTIELYDRLAIAEVKWEKTLANKAELAWYQDHCSVSADVRELYEDLKDIHRRIWALESELKTGREQELALEEIGRRAIAIRDLNNQRINLKNTIAERLGDPVREIKMDHLSE